MTSKKYELIASDVDGLYRVKALMDFGDVKAGDVGGYVAGEHNLSHGGNCWVYGDARVYGNARVYGDAWVYGNARVYDNARIYGDAWVYGDARVYGDAWVYGNARVYDNARIYGGNCWVYGDARVYGNACVYGYARVRGDAWVYGDARVYGDACVSGYARVRGDACVSGYATISNSNDYFIVGPALSSGRYTTVHKTAEGYQINCGCYTTDSIEEFKKRVKGVHSGENLGSYLVIVASLDAWVKSKLKREIENANS